MGRNRQRNNPWGKAFFNLLKFLVQKKALWKMKLADGLQAGKMQHEQKKEENQLQLRASGKTVLK